MEELLPQPFEILELNDGQSITLTIESWEEGEAIIHPRYKEGSKRIKVLRVTVPQAEKEFFPHYWDITAITAVAQLKPLLEAELHKRRKFRITKHGVAPKARFTIETV